MKTDLLGIEHNPYRRAAIIDAVEGIDFKYHKDWVANRSCWIVVGQFVWNIDRALKRAMVSLKKDDRWIAAEYVDDKSLASAEDIACFYKLIDKAMLTRLFKLRRIQRRLQE